MRIYIRGAALSALLALTACQTAPVAYQKPALEAPAVWHAAPDAPSKVAARSDWWTDWHDPVADQLMSAALAQNLDVKVAMARVDEARSLSKINDVRYKPSLYLNGSGAVTAGQKAMGGLNDGDARLGAGVGGNWDIDLYGLQKLESQLGQAGLNAADAQYRGAINSLLGEVAIAYIDLREQQRIYALLQKNIELQSETLRVVKIQTAAGAGVQLDVLRASAQVETTRSQLPSVRAAIQIDCNRIAVLLGEAPGARDALLMPDRDMPVFVTDTALKTPAEVIANRPDVQNAEYQLEQQGLAKSISTADLFPKISLSGFFGLSSSSLFGSSAPLNLAANLSRPLLDYDRIHNQIDAQSARQEQAFLSYKQTVLLAVEDVERSLVVYGEEQQRLTTLDNTSTIQAEAARQARLKFQAGYATFLDVLIAEQQLLDAQLSAVQSRARLTSAGVNLYTALGASVADMPRTMASSEKAPSEKAPNEKAKASRLASQ
ncbi:MAG: efflux transporter outer membrane subunit [Asticcacaulis sp.]